MTTTTEIPPTTATNDTTESANPASATKRPSKLALKRALLEKERISLKNKGQLQIIAIVEQVATVRKVDWKLLFSPDRGNDAVSSARVLAMGLCAALEVPQFIVARAFSRNWATVYSAEVRCSTLYRKNAKFRKEWDTLVAACGSGE
jgi:hypothetical protein